MSAIKKPLRVPSESKMDEETKRFNKRALIGSIIIHLFFFLLKLPHLVLEHTMHLEPKLEPIKMEFITLPVKNAMVQKKVESVASEKVVVPPPETKKIKNGTERVVKKSNRVGDRLKDKVQDVQKGDPKSQKKTAFKPNTDFRKLPKTDVGTGSAPGKIPSPDGNTGGTGDTYKGSDMTNLTDSIMKTGKGLKRIKTNPNGIDDGGAGGGHGGGMGDGTGGGSGDGHFTGTTTGTTNMARVATNVGSLTG